MVPCCGCFSPSLTLFLHSLQRLPTLSQRSEYFDAHLHMHYLLRMEQSGVQDYLATWLNTRLTSQNCCWSKVNELYKMTDDDVAPRIAVGS